MASHVGSYTITASGAVDTDYTISYIAGTLTVTPAPLTITADNQSKVYGATLPTLTVSYAGFVNGDTAASLTTPPTLAHDRDGGQPRRQLCHHRSGAVDADYTISYTSGTLSVTLGGADYHGGQPDQRVRPCHAADAGPLS